MTDNEVLLQASAELRREADDVGSRSAALLAELMEYAVPVSPELEHVAEYDRQLVEIARAFLAEGS